MSSELERIAETDREIARLSAILKQLPFCVVEILTPNQLMESFDLTLDANVTRVVKHEYQMSYDKPISRRRHKHMPPPLWIEQELLLERIGRIISKTCCHLGAEEQLGTERALRLIYRELKLYDFGIITRNVKLKLPRRHF